MRGIGQNIFRMALAAALVCAAPAAWAWEVEGDDEEAVDYGADSAVGASDDGEDSSREEAAASRAASRNAANAAFDDGEDAPARPMKQKFDSSEGKAASDGDADTGKDEDEEDEDARPARKKASKVQEASQDDDDDADLYPKKRGSQRWDRRSDRDDDDDDKDGWLGIGETREPVADDDDDEDKQQAQRSSSGRGKSSNAPWFGESFFDERHIGLTAELTLGGYFRQSSMGDLDGKFGFGLAASWNLGRMFFEHDSDSFFSFLNRGLWIQLSWLHPFDASGQTGTDAVQVSQSQHNLSLTAMVGYPLWRLFVYGKLGPSLYVGSLEYDVMGSKASWSVVRGGITYGVGVHTMFFVCDVVALSARLELLGQKRSYYNDLQLTLNLGVGF